MDSAKWQKLTLAQQLGNIGSEFHRAVSFKKKGDDINSHKSFTETLNLLDLTISIYKGTYRIKELLILLDVVNDLMTGSAVYKADSKVLNKFFLAFAIAARNQR